MMLSAIAVRNAAKAAQLSQKSSSHGTKNDLQDLSPSQSSSESDLSSFLEAPPRKRKALELDSPRKKRPRKDRRKNADAGRPRYFEASEPIPGFDDEPTFSSAAASEPGLTPRKYSPSRPVLDVDPEGVLSNSDSGFEAPRQSRRFSPSRPVADSSEDEDSIPRNDPGPDGHMMAPLSEEARTHGTAFMPTPGSNVFQLTSADLDLLKLPPRDLAASNATLLRLASGESFSFIGTACITLLHGTITILGSTITPSLHAHRIFSPRSSPLVSLEAKDPQFTAMQSSVSSHCNTILNGGSLPDRIQSTVKVSDSVIIIQRLQTAVEGLGKVCRTFDGVFDVASQMKGSQTGSIGVDGFHLVNPLTNPRSHFQTFYLPNSWTKALDTAVPLASLPGEDLVAPSCSPFIGLVRGPKKCGKSTFARTLLNRLTTRYKHVAFLECDLGQSEFTPGGMVSLHVLSNAVFGPPFTHPIIPYRAHYIGHITPRSSPSHYLACIEALVQSYRTDVQYAYEEISKIGASAGEAIFNDERNEELVPLVVNTQGWIKGLGADLLRKIEELVGATHIFDFDTQTTMLPQQRTQPSLASIHTLHAIPASPLTAYYTPADHRSLAILSYFHSLFASQRPGSEVVRWITDLPLCARLPWEVDCREAIDQIILVGAGFEDVVPRELSYAINCSVVALVCDEEHKGVMEDRESQITSPFPYTQGAPPPDPGTSHCMGLALVRGVDATTHTLHILTPLPSAGFTRCRILVKGELELPVWGMLDFREGQDGVAGVPWGKVPYLQMGGRVGTVGAGAGRRRVRRNLMRRSQM